MFLRNVINTLFFKSPENNRIFNVLNSDLLKGTLVYLDRKDLTRLGQVHSMFQEAIIVPRILNLLAQYKLHHKEVEEIKALQKVGFILHFEGQVVTNPVLLALELEIQNNPGAVFERSVVPDPRGGNFSGSAFEYAALTGNFIVLQIFLRHPLLKDTKEMRTALLGLEKYRKNFLQFDKLIQDFNTYAKHFYKGKDNKGICESLECPFHGMHCTKGYRDLVGINYKTIPAWVAQLACSGILLEYTSGNFTKLIIEAQSTDLFPVFTNYYSGTEASEVEFYKEPFDRGITFSGGWASTFGPTYIGDETRAFIQLNKAIATGFEQIFQPPEEKAAIEAAPEALALK